MLTGEQSNTSLVFGESAILKVFRRVAPGPNPDLEVAAALAELGSTHIAEPLRLDRDRGLDGAPTVLGHPVPLPARRLGRLVAGRDQRP